MPNPLGRNNGPVGPSLLNPRFAGDAQLGDAESAVCVPEAEQHGAL